MVRYRETRLGAHLKNMGKYATGMAAQASAIVYSYNKGEAWALALFLGLNLASTCYSYGWDLYMDWGLLRTK